MKHIVVKLVFLALASGVAQGENWPQFRGPAGTGIGVDAPGIPVVFGPGRSVLWKSRVEAGHSSPSVWGERIFLTAFEKEGQRLLVVCLDRQTGKMVWEKQVPAAEIEKVHSISSPATATPVTDGERVYAYFGSAGLFAFDVEGKPVWSHPLPVSKAAFGSGTSPVLDGEMVLLSRDEGKEPFLLALNKRTGEVIWKAPQGTEKRPWGFGHSTPVVQGEEIIVHRQFGLVAFDRKTGARKWWVETPTQGNCTPVLGGGAVYVGTWTNAGEPDLRVPYPKFAEVISKADKNGDGVMQEGEFPEGIDMTRRIDLDGVEGASMSLGKWAFKNMDKDKDGTVTAAEWDTTLGEWEKTTRDHAIIAVKVGGEGNVTETNVLWREIRNVPEIPAPLYYRERLYAVTNGGIMTCLDAKTGKVIFRGRLGAGGGYFSSPVAVNGRVYFSSGDGVVTVIDGAAEELKVLARNDLEEALFATPAIVDGKLYIRTANHVYAFGEKEEAPVSQAARSRRR